MSHPHACALDSSSHSSAYDGYVHLFHGEGGEGASVQKAHPDLKREREKKNVLAVSYTKKKEKSGLGVGGGVSK